MAGDQQHLTAERQAGPAAQRHHGVFVVDGHHFGLRRVDAVQQRQTGIECQALQSDVEHGTLPPVSTHHGRGNQQRVAGREGATPFVAAIGTVHQRVAACLQLGIYAAAEVELDTASAPPCDDGAADVVAGQKGDMAGGVGGSAFGCGTAGCMPDQMLDAAEKAGLGPYGGINAASLAILRNLPGDTVAKNFQTAVSETRRSIAGLIGNPVLGGSDSDKKLEQADEMLGDKPTMDNLKGAAALLKTALETQRNSMTQSNRFLAKRYGGGQQQAAKPTAVTIIPGEPTAKAADGTPLVVRNGAWIPAQPQ